MSLQVVCRAETLPELAAVLTLAGRSAALIYHAEGPWNSASFEGARHTIQLRFAGSDAAHDAELFIQSLSCHPFEIVGRVVVDAAIIQVDRFAGNAKIGPVTTLVLQLLTIKD